MGKLSLSRMVCIASMFCVVTAVSSPAQTFTSLASFNRSNGWNPLGTLVQGLDGNFYGTTSAGGANGHGTVFKIAPGGTLTTVYTFCSQLNCVDGSSPLAGLLQSSDGNLYGTTQGGGVYFLGTVFKMTTAGALTTVYSFCHQLKCPDGSSPSAGLVLATDGNLYGTSYNTFFKVAPSSVLTTLYTFCAQTGCIDGVFPNTLVQGIDGNFYGTTQQGGAHGDGTVFVITPGGTLTTLYNFCSQLNCADGSFPMGALVQNTDGNLYGTTNTTVFKITPRGALTTLYSFCAQAGCPDGFGAEGLVRATDGNFYGTTQHGGINNCINNGCGTVFRITPSGILTTLHKFDGVDGGSPSSGLVQGTDGNFYGTTQQGGVSNNCNYGCGTVFSLSVGLSPFVETIPTSGAVGAAVIILGNNLTGTTGVRFNGTAATFTVVSSSEIKTTVPVGATTGTVQVTTPSGTLNSNVPFQVTKTRRRLVQVTSE